MKTITSHYIDGAFVESHGRDLMDLGSPANGKTIARVTLGDEADARLAIAAAKRAFATFGRSTEEERASILRRLHEVVAAWSDDLTAMMVEEFGGVVRFAGPIVQLAANAFLEAEKALHEVPWSRAWGTTTVAYQPLGVAGLITPWNANVAFLCVKLASAIAAGCTAVIKPSELSALQTQVLLECLHQARLPPGLLQRRERPGGRRRGRIRPEHRHGEDLIHGLDGGGQDHHARGRRDDETPDARAGRQIGQRSARRRSPSGGHPEGSRDRFHFMNSGQAWPCGTRLLVPKGRLEEVKRAVVDAMPAFAVGDPADPDTVIGPMVNAKQYERVQSSIRKGLREGAELLVGGEGRPRDLQAGYFVKPTVFVNVKNYMTIAREEIFGPVLCVITYETEEQAIRIANDSIYGLHAYVSGTDIERARRVASKIEVGQEAINGILDDPQAPFGGFKQSGIGRELGTFRIESYLESSAVLE
jgi:aldehyde dehydrogenase (NAD+)